MSESMVTQAWMAVLPLRSAGMSMVYTHLEAMLMSMIPAILEGLIQALLQLGTLFLVCADARNHEEAHNPCSHGP